TPFAFAKHLRNAGLVAGSGPPAFTAMAISFPIRVNCFAMRSQRANMVDLRTSNILPIIIDHSFFIIIPFVGSALSLYPAFVVSPDSYRVTCTAILCSAELMQLKTRWPSGATQQKNY